MVSSSISQLAHVDPSQIPASWRVHHSILLTGWGYMQNDGKLRENWLNGEWNVQKAALNQPSNWKEMLYCMHLSEAPNQSLWHPLGE